MTVMVMKRLDQDEIVVDCEPIEKYEDLLEDACRTNKVPPMELFQLANSMDREQLRHLASILSCMVSRYARLWNHSFTTEHTVMMEELRKLRHFAKELDVDLWPELGD
jgi:3-dehydroquinate dehydratase